MPKKCTAFIGKKLDRGFPNLTAVLKMYTALITIGKAETSKLSIMKTKFPSTKLKENQHELFFYPLARKWYYKIVVI